MKRILVGDIGGTKSDLALYEQGGDVRVPLFKKRYLSGNFASVENLLQQFLTDCGEEIGSISLGVAGPVADGIATVTNLPWSISRQKLQSEFNVDRVSVINDLTAVCAGIPLLLPEDLLTLQQGIENPHEMRGVIAPGTGLGVGVIFDCGDALIARGTEGGHADFAPVDDEQMALLAYLRKRYNKVTSERVAAGPALRVLYEFCRDRRELVESAWVKEKFLTASDVSAVIGESAVSEPYCPLCREVVELFFRIVGGEAANLALRINAIGGMYIGGGILPRFVDKLSFNGLLSAFRLKIDRAPFMNDVPVQLILRRDVALLGAARYGLEPETIGCR